MSHPFLTGYSLSWRKKCYTLCHMLVALHKHVLLFFIVFITIKIWLIFKLYDGTKCLTHSSQVNL